MCFILEKVSNVTNDYNWKDLKILKTTIFS